MHGLTRSARTDAPGKLMDMRGFDPKWRDVPDFIFGITKEIREDRQIASLNRRYSPGLIVRSPASVLVDNSRVVAATFRRSPSELLGKDVISCASTRSSTGRRSGSRSSSQRVEAGS
jgi:hypothetical protein